MALLARAGGNIFHFSNNSFYKFSLNRLKIKLNKKFPPVLSPCHQNCINTRFINTGSPPQNTRKNKYLVFEDALSQRRDQARRSILVQVQSEQSSYELYDYCSKFAKVQEMHHYVVNGSVHFILIEFKTISDVQSINTASAHADVQQNIPVTSPMLWFRAATNGNKKESVSKDIPLTVKNGKAFPNTQAVNDWLLKADSISEQMTLLCKSTALNDTDTRLRFLTARQIEQCLSGMFSNIAVLPFGSSVNGFGKHGCDLDLVLKLQDDAKENETGRLVYHTKAGSTNDRMQTQKIMETISDMMHQFLPGVTRIRKILKARVPIIKYNQSLTGLECDLSMTNTIGIHMSELLYLYGELDWRVRPLIFTVRMWANCVQLTNSSPGPWITNFSLTLLVLFYLQQRKLLPSLQQLVKFASKSDVRIADGCVDCTFLRDISKLPKSSVINRDSLEELLANFFIYYSGFDFATKAVSLNTATPLPKPDSSVIFIYNPLEQGLNVTKNMNIQEAERLKVEMRNAAWLVDSASDNKAMEWGLLSLFHQRIQKESPNKMTKSGRILELTTLFKESSTAETVSIDSGKESLKNNKTSPVSKDVLRHPKIRSSRKQEWRR